MIAERLQIPEAITKTRIIAILRGASRRYLYDACSRLAEAGVFCLEVTTNTPGVFETIARLRSDWGDRVELGAGTVVTAEHVDAAVAAGATFVVAPNLDLAVGNRAAEHSIGWYPGAATPTEILEAWRAGATAVKIFPVASLGGAAYLRQVRAPIDDVPMIPTGGVSLEQIAGYLQIGATAVGLGGPLIGDALESGDLDGLAARATAALAFVAEARSAS